MGWFSDNLNKTKGKQKINIFSGHFPFLNIKQIQVGVTTKIEINITVGANETERSAIKSAKSPVKSYKKQ